MKIEVEALKELIAKFEITPSQVKEELKLALLLSLRGIQERARNNHRFTSRSGETEREIKTRSENLSGEVYLNSTGAVYQHEGTGIYGPRKRAIKIVPRNVTVLRWVNPGGGGFVFAKNATIKGIKPDPFLYNAAEQERPQILSRFDSAIKKALAR